MITAICPYCEIGIGILFDKCLHDLAIKGQSKCRCVSCNHIFIVFYEKDKLKTKYDNNIRGVNNE